MPDPKHKDAFKRMRQNEQSRARNRAYRSTMRTQIKKLNAAIGSGDVDGAKAQLPEAVSVIQRLAQKGIIHKRQAARRVGRLTRHVNEMSS